MARTFQVAIRQLLTITVSEDGTPTVVASQVIQDSVNEVLSAAPATQVAGPVAKVSRGKRRRLKMAEKSKITGEYKRRTKKRKFPRASSPPDSPHAVEGEEGHEGGAVKRTPKNRKSTRSKAGPSSTSPKGEEGGASGAEGGSGETSSTEGASGKTGGSGPKRRRSQVDDTLRGLVQLVLTLTIPDTRPVTAEGETPVGRKSRIKPTNLRGKPDDMSPAGADE